MAGKITDLTEKLTTSATDLVEVVSGGVNYKVQKSNLVTGLATTDITDITATADEINVLNGIPATLTATEIGYVDGVTSAIQTQLDGKQPLDSDLTTIAGLTATTDNFLVSVSSAWASRTPAQVRATLDLEVGTDFYSIAASDGLITTHAAVTETHGATGEVVGTTNTQTLTNKRITKRVQSVADAATVTPNADNDDCVDITAIAQAFTIANPSGTPTNFQSLVIRIKDNGTARAFTWGNGYVAGGAPLPTTTILSKILTLGFFYNTANSLNKWQLVASSQEI